MRKLALAVVALAAPAASCFPQGQCDGSTAEYCAQGDSTCAGHLIDPYTWQSGPIDGTWLPFPRFRTWTLHFRDAVTNRTLQGVPYSYETYISPVANPVSPGNQLVSIGGNNSEWFISSNDFTTASLLNGTCADYFVYIVVRAEPVGTFPDAGADASPNDATTE